MTQTNRAPSRRAVIAGAAALFVPAAPCLARGPAPTLTIGGPAFGTSWQLTLPAGLDAADVSQAIRAETEAVDAAMSPWRPDSALAKFNAAPPGGLRVPRDAAHVAAQALALAEATGGVFDPSVGPLVARWGFGPIAGDGAGGSEGMQAGTDVLVKARRGQTLDLCGIAKGHALDRIVTLVRGRCDSFLVSLGGELAARGRHPSGRPWQVAVEDPRPGAAGAVDVLALDGMALATSGDRVNGYEFGGRRVGHVIDPRTHAPAGGGVASVSVVAADGLRADGWATALMAAGAADGPTLADEHGIAALFLVRDADGGLRRIETAGFARHRA